MFDQLIYADEDANIFPGLAESWEISEDQLSWTFQLRDDVTFHDGTPFNAEAVKYTFDTIVDPELGSRAAIDLIGPYESTEVVSEIRGSGELLAPICRRLDRLHHLAGRIDG